MLHTTFTIMSRDKDMEPAESRVLRAAAAATAYGSYTTPAATRAARAAHVAMMRDGMSVAALRGMATVLRVLRAHRKLNG